MLQDVSYSNTNLKMCKASLMCHLLAAPWLSIAEMPYNITAESIPLNPGSSPGLKSNQPFPEKNKNHPKVGGKNGGFWSLPKQIHSEISGIYSFDLHLQLYRAQIEGQTDYVSLVLPPWCAKKSKQLALSHISFAWCFRFYLRQSVPFRNFVFRTLFPPATLAATSRRRSVAALLSPSTRLGWTLQKVEG